MSITQQLDSLMKMPQSEQFKVLENMSPSEYFNAIHNTSPEHISMFLEYLTYENDILQAQEKEVELLENEVKEKQKLLDEYMASGNLNLLDTWKL